MHHVPVGAGTNVMAALLATGLHAVSYLTIAFFALLVFDKVGVGILRRTSFTLDLIWGAALLTTGLVTPLI